MTSSYGNVIGTPRDQLPDISDTNYLATDADLTESPVITLNSETA